MTAHLRIAAQHRQDAVTGQGQGCLVTGLHDLTESQAYWLKALLETRPRSNNRLPIRDFRMPDEVSQALTARGLIRRVRGALEITLEGIREIARQPVPDD